jgi:aspartyl-tRNA(Asn)/glutamyl-tRNA(Gln) amidotransferase subunit C
MAIITKDEVRKIAHMSRIAIHDDEIDDITAQLEAVLAYAARVNGVATVAQGPLPQNVNIFREDVVKPFDAERIKAEAPEIEADYFVVPAILEHE